VSLNNATKRAISASDDKTLILWNLEPFMPEPEPAEAPEAPQQAQ
jgi:hypothetical protein